MYKYEDGKKNSIRTERDHIIVQKKGFDVLKRCLFAAAFVIFSWTIFELRIIHETICAGQDFSIVDRRMILDFVRRVKVREAIRMCPWQGEGQMFVFKR